MSCMRGDIYVKDKRKQKAASVPVSSETFGQKTPSFTDGCNTQQTRATLILPHNNLEMRGNEIGNTNMREDGWGIYEDIYDRIYLGHV